MKKTIRLSEEQFYNIVQEEIRKDRARILSKRRMRTIAQNRQREAVARRITENVIRKLTEDSFPTEVSKFDHIPQISTERCTQAAFENAVDCITYGFGAGGWDTCGLPAEKAKRVWQIARKFCNEPN